MKTLTGMKRREERKSNAHRKAETRTKIQLGGLIVKSQLSEFLGITLGDDLQTDQDNWKKTAVILGALHEALERLQKDKHHELLNEWEFLGTKLMKYDYKLIH